MNQPDSIPLLLQAIDFYSECHQELDDKTVDELLQRLGEPGLVAVFELLKAHVDADDELIATYCSRLIVRSRMPGRVEMILEALRLPFRNRGVRDEVREAIYDDAFEDAAFLTDPCFVAESRRLAEVWSNGQLDQFFRFAEVDRNS